LLSLYPPTDAPAFKWDLSDHKQMMIITASYCWHVFLTLIFLLVELWIVKIIYRLFKNISIEMDDLIDIELQKDESDKDYTRLNNYDTKNKRLTLNNQDEDSNDELVMFQNNKINK
jgi:hypothetical protein